MGALGRRSEAGAVTTVDGSPWHDLATNLPGQLLRDQHSAAWAASKSRSALLAYGARLFDAKTDERAWRKGAEGEEYVGPKLNELRKHGWHVLHSVPVGKEGSDIDHVVIGPGGVYTINSKNHQGKHIWVADYAMTVNGKSVPYLRNAKYEAERASKLLRAHVDFDVPVRGCIVVLTGSFTPNVTYKSHPVGASVLTKWDVPKWFRRRPVLLDPNEVEALYDVARRSSTWA